MALSFQRILSLRQLATLKLATAVCNDPEIKDFVKENGCVSFVFPSQETCVFLGDSEELGNVWIWEDLVLDGPIIKSVRKRLEHYKESAFECKIKRDLLPFQRWEDLVKKKISKFSLPQCLVSELLEMIRSVSIEIDVWIKDLSLFLNRSAEIAHTAQCYFQWNSLGHIDRVETARRLIKNEASTVEDLYILALHYDLVDMFMDENRKAECEKYAVFSMQYEELHGEDELRRTSAGESGFHSIRNHFITSPTGHRVAIVNSLLENQRLQYEDLLFCMAQMDEDEKEEVFKSNHLKILLFFLDWPLQNQFKEAAELLLLHFTIDSLNDIMCFIINERILPGRKGFDYSELIRDFWFASSLELKQGLMSKYIGINDTLGLIDVKAFRDNRLQKEFDAIAFGYRGIKYCLFKNLNFPKYSLYRGFRYVPMFSFMETLKRKHVDFQYNG